MKVVTLDALLSLFPEPRFIKIDVEGLEAEVVRGADHLLRYIRPIWLIEVHPGAFECLGILERADYDTEEIGTTVSGHVYLLATPKLLPTLNPVN